MAPSRFLEKVKDVKVNNTKVTVLLCLVPCPRVEPHVRQEGHATGPPKQSRKHAAFNKAKALSRCASDSLISLLAARRAITPHPKAVAARHQRVPEPGSLGHHLLARSYGSKRSLKFARRHPRPPPGPSPLRYCINASDKFAQRQSAHGMSDQAQEFNWDTWSAVVLMDDYAQSLSPGTSIFEEDWVTDSEPNWAVLNPMDDDGD